MFFHFDEASKSFEISFDPENFLQSAIISQIFTDQKDSQNCDTGWWAEELLDLKVGSELYKLKRAKLTDENVELAVQSVTNAINLLQQSQLITLFDVLPEARPNALILRVQAKPANQPRMVNFGFRVPFT